MGVYHFQVVRAQEQVDRIGGRTRWDMSLSDGTHVQTRVLVDPALHNTDLITADGRPIYALVAVQRALILTMCPPSQPAHTHTRRVIFVFFYCKRFC